MPRSLPGQRRSVAVAAPTKKKLSKREAQQIVLDGIASGMSVRAACAAAGRTEQGGHREWMRTDPAYKAEVERMRAVRQEAQDSGEQLDDGRLPVPDFPTFCEELGQPLFPHQLRTWDVLEGRPPRDMLTCFRYIEGGEWEPLGEDLPSGRVIINQPPGHAKTTTFSINYCTWMIHKNPNIRIVVICKDQSLAKQILGAVKFRLVSPVFRELHLKYAPEGGWKDQDASWTQTEIYVQGKNDGEKDPTMQALGIGGRIYGARSDVIVLDDAVTLGNVNEYDKQRRWLDQEVESRLDGGGLLALLGTRIAPIDLYSTMREVVDWDEKPVYTYFSMPALLTEGDDVSQWVPLWPERFPPHRLQKIRRDEATWALVYQQQDVAEDATFTSRAIEASINTQRYPGLGGMTGKAPGTRSNGMDGLYVIGGLDPAGAGNTAMIVCGYDRLVNKRFVIDGFNRKNCSPKDMRDKVKELTDTYHINEWVIERNGVQTILTQDEELTTFLRSRSCRLTPHLTAAGNKFDADYGVAAMAPLFLSCGEPGREDRGGPWSKTPEKALIELPAQRQNAWVAELINQLIVWQPSGMKQLQKTDLVMALWFTQVAVNRLTRNSREGRTHMENPYASLASLRERSVVNISDYLQAQLLEGVG